MQNYHSRKKAVTKYFTRISIIETVAMQALNLQRLTQIKTMCAVLYRSNQFADRKTHVVYSLGHAERAF
jgi:hypothetical protein